MKRNKKKALELKLEKLRNLSSTELDDVAGGAYYAEDGIGGGGCRPSNCGDSCDTVGGISNNDPYAIKR